MILLNHSSCQHPQMTSLAKCISYQLILPLSKPPSGEPGSATMRCLFLRELVFNHSFCTIVLLTAHKEVLLITPECSWQCSKVSSLFVLRAHFSNTLSLTYCYLTALVFFMASGKIHKVVLSAMLTLFLLDKATGNTGSWLDGSRLWNDADRQGSIQDAKV